MPIEILMPALSPTMTEGNLAKWLKKEGDAVHSGDVIAEIETDKATMEVEAIDEGRIGKIIVPEGTQGVKVNAPIALLLGEDEDAAALPQRAAQPPAPAAAPPAPPAPAQRAEAAAPAPRPVAAPAPAPAPTPAAAAVAPGAGEPRLFASPLARRMAQEAGLDLAALRGSGPHGRIIKADIDQALAGGTAAAAVNGGAARPAAAAPIAAAPRQARPLPQPQPQPQPSAMPAATVGFAKEQVLSLAGNPPYTEKPHSAMRRVIARRLTEAKQTIPHFYLTVDCAIDALLDIRKTLNARSDAPRLSVNDFVIRAVALALREVPAANASWSDDAVLLWQRADIAVAVAMEDGLITPIVKGADQKGLAAIAAETKDLAARARAGKLKLEEFQGGTFSISNLGMYGIREFAAVINPPHGCILAVGAGEQRPVVKDGALAVATVMSCTLACDHRVVDGAVGAQFLGAFKKLVEEPLTMLL